MTADPWELLREARMFVECFTLHFYPHEFTASRAPGMLARIDAALAGSQDKPLVKPPSTTWARFAFAFREQAERAERERDEARAEVERLRAALAERQDKPPCSCGQPYPCMKGCPDCCHSQGYLDYCQGDRHAERQDSATDVVESEVEWDRVNAQFFVAYPDNETSLTVSRFDLTRQEWRWDMEREIKRKGFCTTEAEAKSAAIAAARGMR